MLLFVWCNWKAETWIWSSNWSNWSWDQLQAWKSGVVSRLLFSSPRYSNRQLKCLQRREGEWGKNAYFFRQQEIPNWQILIEIVRICVLFGPFRYMESMRHQELPFQPWIFQLEIMFLIFVPLLVSWFLLPDCYYGKLVLIEWIIDKMQCWKCRYGKLSTFCTFIFCIVSGGDLILCCCYG